MTLSFGTLHKLTLTGTGLLAALSVVSGSAFTASAAVILSISLVLGARKLLEMRHSKRKAYLIHGLTMAVLIFAIATFQRSRFDSFLIVVMLGVFNRFHLRGGHRDDFLIAGATAILITAATTVTPGLTFLFILLAYLPCLLWSLWSGMILSGAENAERDPNGARLAGQQTCGPPHIAGELPRALGKRSAQRAKPAESMRLDKKISAVHQMADRPVTGGLGYISVVGILLMMIGFVFVSAFPRFQLTNLFSAGYFMQIPGSTDTLELRTDGVTDLDSGAVVMRVEPNTGGKESGLVGLYARLYVLDEFDGRRFKSTDSNALYPVGSERLGGKSQPEMQPELTEADGTEAVRVTLSRVTRDRLHPIATLGRSGPTEVQRRYVHQTMSGTWTFGPMTNTTMVYKARLDHPLRKTALPALLQTARDERLLELPASLDPRIVELGKKIIEGKTTHKEKVSALLGYFSKDFRYSLAPLKGESGDPLIKFLFEAKQGHCELYAGALAVLLRVAGVKSRVATGYYGGSWNRVGGYLVFTPQDAHAWVEAYDEDEGWTWLDATPEDQRVQRQRSTLELLRDFYGAAEAFWYDNIIDFDERKRKLFLGRLEERFKSVKSAVFGEEESYGGREESARSPMGSSAAIGGLAIASIALGALIVRRRRARPEIVGLRLRKILGADPGENVTLRRLIARVPKAVVGQAEDAIALYEALRFGPENVAPTTSVVLSSVRALERSIWRAKRAR